MPSRLERKRKKLGLTRKQLAEKIGVSSESIYKYERGERTPSDDKKIKLAKVYGTTVGELFFNGK